MVNWDSYLNCFLKELSKECLNKLYFPKVRNYSAPNIRTCNFQHLQRLNAAILYLREHCAVRAMAIKSDSIKSLMGNKMLTYHIHFCPKECKNIN